MPRGTAPGFPLFSTTSSSRKWKENFRPRRNPAPAALGQPRRALLGSSAFAQVFLETQLCSWRCRTGISRPLRVSPGQSAALVLGGTCLSGRGWSSRGALPACGTGREAGYGGRGPALTLVSFPSCSVPDACVCPLHGGYDPERPPRGGRSGKWAGQVIWLDLQEPGRSRKCCQSVRGLQELFAFWTGLSDWGRVDGGAEGGRERRCRGTCTFLFQKRPQASCRARLEQVAHTCMPWKLGLLASPAPRSLSQVPRLKMPSEIVPGHASFCTCVLAENVSAQFMPLSLFIYTSSFFSLFCRTFWELVAYIMMANPSIIPYSTWLQCNHHCNFCS